MKPYTLTIRFRETDEYEAEVGAFMRDLSKHTDKSKNRFIIDLIGDYMKRSEQEQQEEAIIEKLRKMIRCFADSKSYEICCHRCFQS